MFNFDIVVKNNKIEWVYYCFSRRQIFIKSDNKYIPTLEELYRIYDSINRGIEIEWIICDDVTIKFYGEDSSEPDIEYLDIPIGISVSSRNIRVKFMDEINKLMNIMTELNNLQSTYEGIQRALVFNCNFLLEKYVNRNLNKKIIEWTFSSFDDSFQSLLYFMIYNNNHKIIKILLDNNIVISQDDMNCMKKFGDSATQKLICNSQQYLTGEFNHKRKAED